MLHLRRSSLIARLSVFVSLGAFLTWCAPSSTRRDSRAFVGAGVSSKALQASPYKPSARSRVVAMRGGNGKDGPFTPIVKLFRWIIGEKEFTMIKGKAIKAHSDVIALALDTHDTPYGQVMMRQLFQAADVDGSGKLDHEEVRVALKNLGFEWMDNDKKVAQVMKKGDANGDELIDFEEFAQVAPTTLRQNLVKLAKENGNNLGFLS